MRDCLRKVPFPCQHFQNILFIFSEIPKVKNMFILSLQDPHPTRALESLSGAVSLNEIQYAPR